MKLDVKSWITTSVKNCARCGKNHKDITFMRFKNPPTTHTHWSMCPNANEPILMKMVDDKDDK